MKFKLYKIFTMFIAKCYIFIPSFHHSVQVKMMVTLSIEQMIFYSYLEIQANICSQLMVLKVSLLSLTCLGLYFPWHFLSSWFLCVKNLLSCSRPAKDDLNVQVCLLATCTESTWHICCHRIRWSFFFHRWRVFPMLTPSKHLCRPFRSKWRQYYVRSMHIGFKVANSDLANM